MNRSTRILTKLFLLGASVCSTSLLAASCSMSDVQDSMVSAVLGYVKASTGEVLTSMLPSWKDVLKGA